MKRFLSGVLAVLLTFNIPLSVSSAEEAPLNKVFTTALSSEFQKVTEAQAPGGYYYKYVGANKYVEIPETIKGEGVSSYYKMFKDNKVVRAVKPNNGVTDWTSMFENSSIEYIPKITPNIINTSKAFKGTDITGTFAVFNDTVTNVSEMFSSPAKVKSYTKAGSMYNSLGTANVTLTDLPKEIASASSLLQGATQVIDKGATKSLNLIVNPLDAENKDFVYRSSNPSIIDVDNKGNVKGINNGTAYILYESIQNSSVGGRVDFSVTNSSRYTNISLPASEIELGVGQTLTVDFVKTPAVADIKEVATSITPSGLVKLTGDVNISNSLTFEGLGVGVATITFNESVTGFTGSFNINVNNNLRSIELPTTITTEVGKGVSIAVAKVPATAVDELSYAITDTTIAKYEAGSVHGLKNGTTIMEVSSKSNPAIKTTTTVNVTGQPIDTTKPTSISLSKTTVDLDIDDTYTISATNVPSSITSGFNYESEDRDIASVNSSGKITANKRGSTYVKVISDKDSSVYSRIKVIVDNGDSKSDSGKLDIKFDYNLSPTNQPLQVKVSGGKDAKYILTNNAIQQNGSEGTFNVVVNGNYDAGALDSDDKRKTDRLKIDNIDYVFPTLEYTAEQKKESTILKLTADDDQKLDKVRVAGTESSNKDVNSELKDGERKEVIITDKAGNTINRIFERRALQLKDSTEKAHLQILNVPNSISNQKVEITFNVIGLCCADLKLQVNGITRDLDKDGSQFKYTPKFDEKELKVIVYNEGKEVASTIVNCIGYDQTKPKIDLKTVSDKIQADVEDTDSGILNTYDPTGKVGTSYTAKYNGEYRFYVFDKALNYEYKDAKISSSDRPAYKVEPGTTSAKDSAPSKVFTGKLTGTVNSSDIPTLQDSNLNIKLKDGIKVKATGFIGGYADKTMRPNSKVTRAEFVNMVNQVLEFEGSPQGSIYPDVQNTWYKDAVNNLTINGIMPVKPDAKFAGNVAITREDAVFILMGALNSDEQTPNSNFKDINKSSNPTLLGKAVSLGITSGYQDGTIKPKGTLTRAEAVAIINRVFAPSSSTKDLSKFKDIKKGAWYYNEISKALK